MVLMYKLFCILNKYLLRPHRQNRCRLKIARVLFKTIVPISVDPIEIVARKTTPICLQSIGWDRIRRRWIKFLHISYFQWQIKRFYKTDIRSSAMQTFCSVWADRRVFGAQPIIGSFNIYIDIYISGLNSNFKQQFARHVEKKPHLLLTDEGSLQI